jgi:hypothetical protein
MLDGSSTPPSANAFVWSTTYPGQLPVDLPVDGQGFCRSNCRLASRLLFIFPFEFRVHDAHRPLREWCLLLACPEVRVDDEWWVPLAWCRIPASDRGTMAKIIPRTKAWQVKLQWKSLLNFGHRRFSQWCSGEPELILGRIYCNFAYSALASFKIGISGSASFQSVRKS